MKTLLFIFSFMYFHVCAFSQNLIAKYYGDLISRDSLKNYIYTLASDKFEGRETGKQGQKLAAQYIASHFKSSGLKAPVNNQYFQIIPLSENKPAQSNLYINDTSFEFLKDYYFFRGFDDTLLVSDKITFLGYGISDTLYNDFKNLNVKGKSLLILNGEPLDSVGNYLVSGTKAQSEWSRRWKTKINYFSALQAAMVFVVIDSIEKNIKSIKHSIESSGFEITGSEKFDKQVPFIYISKELGNFLLKNSQFTVDSLSSYISKKRNAPVFEVSSKLKFVSSKNIVKTHSENVLGYLEGSDPVLKNEILIITAHYDHLGISDDKIYYGADDDASGTSSVIELSRIFSLAANEGHRPKRSIIFMTVSGEEKGLLGSEYFVNKPVFPLSSFIANLNIDMIGRLDSKHSNNPNYIYIIGSDKLSKDLHLRNENANSTYTQLELDYTYNDLKDPNRFYYRSDHYNFAKNNIPVIFYFNGVHEDYHKHTDTPDKIDFTKVKNITKLIFHTAWDIVNNDKSIIVD